MGMAGMCVRYAGLGCPVGFRPGVEVRIQLIWWALMPLDAPAIRFGPRLVASASTPASMAETFSARHPVRTWVKQSANPVHSCTSLKRSGTSTNGYSSLISALRSSAAAGTSPTAGVTISVPPSDAHRRASRYRAPCASCFRLKSSICCASASHAAPSFLDTEPEAYPHLSGMAKADRGIRCSSNGRNDRLPSTQMSADLTGLAKPRVLQSRRDGDRASACLEN